MEKAKCTKIKHPTEWQANNVIARAWAGAMQWQGKRLPIRCYKCRCGFWHLTSKPFMTKDELLQTEVVE